MKKHLIIFCIISLPFISLSQIHFKENIIIDKLIDGVRDVVPADLDQDGDLDLLVASMDNHLLLWFENDGQGNFDSYHIIEFEAYGVFSVFASDLDGDGDKDVLATLRYVDKIVWYENLGGGNFGLQQVISTLVNDPATVFAIDLDEDGDNDVISALLDDNKIVWYENDSLGNFGLQQVITTNVIWPFSVFSIDIDGDSVNDVLSSSLLDNKIAWYKNLGNGIFGPQQIITTLAFGPGLIFSTDLDGDGDNDVLSTSHLDKKVAWYENLGEGMFGPQQIISDQLNKPYSVIAYDVDGDGDNDVIFSTAYMNQGSFWAENDGYGGFTSPILIESTIISFSTTCSDLDGDMDLDITAAGYRNLAWYPNDSVGNFGLRHNITYGLNYPTTLFLSDLDGDGKKDIISGSDQSGNEIYWFKNFGNGNYFLTDTIGDTNFGIQNILAADLDNDGDNDVLTVLNEEHIICWYTNDGLGNFGPAQIISNIASVVLSIAVGDIDGDGDCDIVAGFTTNTSGSLGTKKLSLWKNNGFGIFGNEILLTIGGQYGFENVNIVDLDNDGDMDILYSAGQVFWCEQVGASSFSMHFISAGMGWANRIATADLDGDNDLDIICSADDATGNGDIRWWKNNGSGNFTSMPHIVTWLVEPFPFSVIDLDNDGDMDIIGNQALLSNPLFWFENDGLANFGPMQYITDSVNIYSIITADLDGDGDYDILYNSVFDGEILWAENLGFRTTATDSACANLPYVFGSQILNYPGTYHDTLQTVFGLDSVIELAFTQLPVPAVGIAPFPQDTFCIQTGAIDFPLVSPAGGSFSGPGVTATNINLNLADTGTHEISYLYTDTTTGCANSDTTQFVVIDCLTIPEALELGVSVYPNPADNFITVEGKNLPAGGKVQIRLFDVSAKVVREESPGGFPYKMDIGQLKPGVYYLQLYTGEKTVVYKLVKR